MMAPDGTMVIYRPRCLLMPAFALLAGISPAAAEAQCLLCSDADTGSTVANGRASDDEELTPLRVTVVADLDFSRLVNDGRGGSITIDPSTGQSRADGAVSSIGGSGFSGRAIVEGAPGRTVRVDLPHDVRLTSTNGGEARITDIVSSLPPRARLGPDGRLEFAFGGRLELDGRSDGDFRGRIQITVSYE